MRTQFFAPALAAWLAAGCASVEPPPEGWRSRMAAAPTPSENAFPMPPAELEKRMRSTDFEMLEFERTKSGVAGAMKMKVRYSGGTTLDSKWKTAPEGGDGWNNTPRREVASYRIQQWFLDPGDFVVPPTVALCIPFERFPDDFDGEPSFAGTDCAFGAQSAWLEDVTVPDPLLDVDRFYRDGVYARHLAHYNLLTYLTENRDTRAGNYLASEDESNRRVYSVDNGLTFGTWLFNYFRWHWDEIRVPALPSEAIERLRDVEESDLDALSVVAEFWRDEDGMLREVSASPVFDPDRGVRSRGDRIQLGLTDREIDTVRRRLRELLTAVDRGQILVF